MSTRRRMEVRRQVTWAAFEGEEKNKRMIMRFASVKDA
jgi:hypothetical protein